MVDETGGFDELVANVAAVECPFQITNTPDTPIVFKARRDKGRCRTPNKIETFGAHVTVAVQMAGGDEADLMGGTKA